jgi:PilZ domain-containing protein
MSSEDRRGAPRGTFDLPVQVRSGESSSTARLKSLSRLGALLRAGETYPVGTPLGLLLALPGPGEEMLVRGQVIRVTPSEGMYDVAILFAPLLPATLARIESFVASMPSD